jgi:TRAP-type uncharacterized transport system fused permease subunit
LGSYFLSFGFPAIASFEPYVAWSFASFTAAGMAQADPRKTSWIALKMGLATFIVPFMSFYAPVLLMKATGRTSWGPR